MGVEFLDKHHYSVIRLTGDCRSRVVPELGQTIARWFRQEPIHPVWDVRRLSRLDSTAFGAMAGSMVVQLVRRQPAVIIGGPAVLGSFLHAAGLATRIHRVNDEDEAVVALVTNVTKRYDRFFFDLLIKRGYLPISKVDEYVEMLRSGRNRFDFGLLLVRRGSITPVQLLECINLQKSRLGEILVDSGVLSEKMLQRLVEEQQTSGARERLGDVLLRLGIASDEDLYEGLSEQARRRRRFRSSTETKPLVSPAPRGNILLGEILLENQAIESAQLSVAVERQRQQGGAQRLGRILQELGFVDESALFGALLTQFSRRQESRPAAEEDPEVRHALDEVLRKLDTNDYLQVHRVRRAIFPMGRPGVEGLQRAANWNSVAVRTHAATLLGDVGGRAAVETLISLLKSSEPDIVDAAGWSLMRISRRLLSFTRPGDWIAWWADVKHEAAEEPVHGFNDSPHDIEPRLKDMVHTGALLDPLVLEYSVGIPEWLGGRTRMMVCGTGQVLVANRYKATWNFYEGRVAPPEMRALIWSLLKHSTLHVSSERTLGATNESLHEIVVQVGLRHRCVSFLWYGELVAHPPFVAFEKQLRRLLKQITNGRVW